ncbi:MAG: hypothetical protein ACE5Q6_13560 [Dehalococcoidia bacterium]
MEDLNSQIEVLEVRVAGVIQSFGDVAGRLEPLEAQFQQVHKYAQREQELQRYIRDHRPNWFALRGLEETAKKVQGQVAYQQRLEAQIKAIQERLATVPQLQQRQRILVQQVKKLEAQEAAIAEHERQVAARSNQLQSRDRQVKRFQSGGP